MAGQTFAEQVAAARLALVKEMAIMAKICPLLVDASVSGLTTADMMAIAHLRGDKVAARALADALLETWDGSEAEVVPVRRLSVTGEHLRAVCYVDNAVLGTHVEIDIERMRKVVENWLDGKTRVLWVSGFSRVEVYTIQAGVCEVRSP